MARLFYKIMKPVIQRRAFSFLHEKNLQRKIDSLITMKLLANCTIGQKIGATASSKLADLPFTGYARAYPKFTGFDKFFIPSSFWVHDARQAQILLSYAKVSQC